MGKKKRKPWGWGIDIDWMSTMWGPSGPVPPEEDEGSEMPGMGRPVSRVIEDGEGPDDSWLAKKDLHKDPAWKEWLTENMNRDDLYFTVRVDEVPKTKVTTGYSRTTGERSFTYWLPVHEFLAEGATVRDVMRAAYVALYQHVATKLDLPAPPPDPGRRRAAA